MEKRVEGSERITGPLKSTALFPERALPVDALLISYCLLQLQSHAGLSGEAGGSGLEGGFQASRAECAVSSQEQGLATAGGRCAVCQAGEGRGGRKWLPLDVCSFYLCMYVCMYVWLRWVFIAARGLSLVAASGGYSSLQCVGFSLWWLLLLRTMGSRHAGFSSCGMWAQ